MTPVVADPTFQIRRSPASMDVAFENGALVVPPSVRAYLLLTGGGATAEVLMATLWSFPSNACLQFGWSHAELADLYQGLSEILEGVVDSEILRPSPASPVSFDAMLRR